MTLESYNRKRHFANTPEPKGTIRGEEGQRFVVQEHHASHLHYDFRLEMGGVLKSWAVPKGPSMDPRHRRLAVQVEDHPVDYLLFEGEISEGNYGAGQVVVWDTGTYQMVESIDPLQAYESGKLTFILHGAKLKGQFSLLRMQRKNQWLLIKSNDAFAQQESELEPLVAHDPDHPVRKRPRTKPLPTLMPRPSAPHKRRAAAAIANLSPVTLETFIAAEPKENALVQTPDGTVHVTHLSKPYFPAAGHTKGDLLRYYAQIARTLVPHLQGRPLILKRYPNGIDAPFFFQHEFANPPDYVHTQTEESEDGRTIEYALIDNSAALLCLTNLGTIEEHPWHSRVQDIDHPDWVVFDLDPEDAEFKAVCEVALALRDTLERFGLRGYPKTSGSRGMHIFVPIEPRYLYDQVAAFAEQVAATVARENPKCATVQRSLSKREQGRVYVDHLQNAKGKTVAAAYSARARPLATVSAPLQWQEVSQCVDPAEFTIATMPRRLQEKGDPFRPVLEQKQSLDAAIGRLQKQLNGRRRGVDHNDGAQPHRSTSRG